MVIGFRPAQGCKVRGSATDTSTQSQGVGDRGWSCLLRRDFAFPTFLSPTPICHATACNSTVAILAQGTTSWLATRSPVFPFSPVHHHADPVRQQGVWDLGSTGQGSLLSSPPCWRAKSACWRNPRVCTCARFVLHLNFHHHASQRSFQNRTNLSPFTKGCRGSDALMRLFNFLRGLRSQLNNRSSK